MEQLFKVVRSRCSPGTWSQAVELVRRCAVTGVSSTDEEIVCRVKKPGRVVAATVTLFPEDAEWDTDCGCEQDPCECVAAVAIAVRRAREEGHSLPELRGAQSKLVYRLVREKLGLVLDRFILRADGTGERLTRSLATLASEDGQLSPSQADLNVDRALGGKFGGVLQTDTLRNVLTLLGDAPNVELDGASIQVATDALRPTGVLDDERDGFAFTLDHPAAVTDVVAPGVVMSGGKLCRLDETSLAGAQFERLPHKTTYRRADAQRLVTEILPALQRRFDVEVRTRRLPKVTREHKPRIVVDVEQVGHSLSLFATLVYGDPPLARVDRGTLVHLGGDIPIRDADAERRAVQRLKDGLQLVPGTRVHVSGAEATQFASRLDTWKDEIRGRGPGRFISPGTLVPVLSTESDRFELHFQGAPGKGGEEAGRASLADAISAWQSGLSLVPLMGGGWAPLPGAFLEKHGQRILDLLEARKSGDGELRAYALPELAQLCDELGAPRPPALGDVEALFGGALGIPEAPLPDDLTATLRPYQRAGINWLGFMRRAKLGATLADDMGLGKTLQALACIQGKTLVVCPTSVIHNWALEATKFRPSLRVAKYHGPKRELRKDADLILTTYAILRLDQEQLGSVSWDAVILDEAQMIKNPDSQMARAAYTLNAEFRLTLTGTPVENRLEELWSQFHFTNPGLLGGRTAFRERFTDPILLGDTDAPGKLRRKIAPFLLRRLKREVAPELPPRTDVVLHAELDEGERILYDAIRAATQTEVVDRLREGGDVMAALEALLRLRQAACHSALVPGQTAPTSSKVEVLVRALETASADGHKALVFSQWTSFLDLVEPHLTERGLAFTRLDGSTRDRAGVVAQFQAADGPPVMLLSLKAGGTGLNLTSADHVFLLDLWWNPAVEDQAADRAHRIGQERPVMVYRIVSRDTVEERILSLQDRKRELADVALGDANTAAGLTREDLLALLAD